MASMAIVHDENEDDKGTLSLSHAKKFIEDHNSIDLGTFTAIDDDAAEALGKFDGLFLSLELLTSLSDKAAKALGKKAQFHSKL